MRFAGRLVKSGKWFAVEVPMLGIVTQGRNKVNAYLMIRDAIESLVDKEGFAVTVYPGKGNYFEVAANDHAIWVAFLLRCQRMVRGLSIADMAKRIGASQSTYARYEKGESAPTADRLMELLAALQPDRDFVLNEATA